MPWKEATSMSLKREFVNLVERGCLSALCRRFNISRKTGYKWCGRFRKEGMEGLKDRSKRPFTSPWKTQAGTERAILRIRDHHPSWGGRKLRRRLLDLGFSEVPAPSTITEVLRRNGRLRLEEAEKHAPFKRFEQSTANDLWQMDFKGSFLIGLKPCYPLTVLDDHSRFALLIEACADQRRETVQNRLVTAFERYGLPLRMLTDNGGPWGPERYTHLSVWWIRLGIGVCRSRVCHPQTIGKDERFHRTLKTELIGTRQFQDILECQQHFSKWRDVYNNDRPHEALGLNTPTSRYTISLRAYPSVLPPIEYGVQDAVRKVQGKGEIWFHNREWHVGNAFKGYAVGVRPTTGDGVYDVYFCHQKIATLDLHEPEKKA
jgi:transposase InsO family protein